MLCFLFLRAGSYMYICVSVHATPRFAPRFACHWCSPRPLSVNTSHSCACCCRCVCPATGGQPRALNFSTGSPGSGFTRHLAGTFGDKAAGFSQRLGQQNAAAGSSAGLLGGLAGTGLHGSSSGDLLGSACGSTDGSNAADAAASSIDGSSASMLAAADRPAAAGHSRGLSSLSTTASIESGNDFTAVKQPQPDSPTSSSSLQGPGASMDSRGSGSWPTPESPQDGQLKAK